MSDAHRTIEAMFKGVHYVGWRPVDDKAGTQEWVRMRSGAGELGWWHRHEGQAKDFGSNPVDSNGKCRTCQKAKP